MLVAASALSGMRISYVDVATGMLCVVAETLQESKVYCLGQGWSGALGSGGSSEGSKTPVAIQGLRTNVRIGHLVSSPSRFVCVSYVGTGEFDTVQCWGGGFGTTPVDILGTVGTRALAEGSEICALLRGGTVVCWGTQDVVAVPVPGISDAVWIVGTGSFVCALTRAPLRPDAPGSVWCWGCENGVSWSQTPSRVEALAGNVLDIAAGGRHVCAVVGTDAGSGDVYCWGDNLNGQLGQGYTNDTMTSMEVLPPLRVKGISKVTAVFAGHYLACTRTVSQRVFCWGANYDGQLGLGISTWQITLPYAVRGLCA